MCMQVLSMFFPGFMAHFLVIATKLLQSRDAPLLDGAFIFSSTSWLRMVWGDSEQRAINICMQHLCGYKFSTHLHNTKEHDSRMAWSEDARAVRNCRTAFRRGCAMLHPRQQRTRVPAAPRSHQHLVLSVFFFLS